ncbi:MAG: hypothetical protein KDA88_22020 [Planctomycetaceae bacterium]|nr:hypothetical protein [Planctomycetaceae bacterium]MCB9954043.1 hypothetical protein [Planctomycetaceae bacterium]
MSLLFTLVVLWPLSVFTAMYRIEMLDQAIAFGIELPKLTQWAFYVPAATFPACATLLSIVLIVKEIVWSNKWGSLIANLIALGAIVVGYLMYWVILALPVRDMIEQLS